MGRQLPGKGLPARLREAQNTKDWGEVSCILDEATGSDANAIKPIMTELVTHRNWLVRASAVEAVGVFRQRQFVDLIQARLRDTNNTDSEKSVRGTDFVILRRSRRIWPSNRRLLSFAAQVLHSAALRSG